MSEANRGVGRLLGGLWCNDVLARLPDLVEGTLSAADLARVQEHVRGCTECDRFGGRYGALVKTLRGAPPAEEDTASVVLLLQRVTGGA